MFNTLTLQQESIFLAQTVQSILVFGLPDKPTSAPKSLTRIIHRLLATLSSSITKSMFIIALKLIHRTVLTCQKPLVNGAQPHLFCISLIVSQKLLKDHAFRNQAWSRITQLPVQVITKLEREFLNALDFDIHITKAEYDDWEFLIEELASRFSMPISPLLSPLVLPPRISIGKKSIDPSLPLTPISTPKRRRSFDSCIPSIKKTKI